MAAPTLPDHKEDETKDRIQEHYDDNLGAYATHGQDQLEAYLRDQNAAAEEAKNLEGQASGAPKAGESLKDDESSPGDWKNNITPDGSRKLDNLNKPKLEKAIGFAKKRGGLIGLIALFGVGGGLLVSFFGPASMLINLMENATIKNDSSSTVLERRFMKVLGLNTKPTDPICEQKPNNLKCKKGKISNSALDKLAAKGITPEFDNDADNTSRKTTGYPSKNPVAYVITNPGQDPVRVEAADLIKHLENNPKDAAKVLGRSGAFKLRVASWSGRHITAGFYDRFGLKKDGGIADGKNQKLSASERYAAALEKLRSIIPGAEKLSTAADGVRTKVESQLGKAKLGGTAYMLAVAGCISVKTPGYIAATVAAVQLAQVMPVGMDLVLSPGAKAKVSGVDTEHSITAEDAETAGVLFTNQTPRESDGKMTSALDSEILQSAIGVNKGKPTVSPDYTPGYSVLTSPQMQAARELSIASEPACNVIMSPAAMWSAFAVDSAITVAASATIIGGIVKVLASLAVGEVATRVAVEVAGDAARAAILDVAQNDKIPKAEGQALGDVTGIALMSFFSAGSAARHLPVLKTSQLTAFEKIKQENIAFEREMDIATLSPFDTSSKYTLLGSAVNSMQMAVTTNGLYNGSFSSILASIARLPSLAFSQNASAEEYTDNYCDYAGEAYLEAGDDTPCILASLTPGYGLTAEQDAMLSEEAFDLVEPWTDENKTINDTDSIEDLVNSGYLKAETPLTENIAGCSDLSTGDYVYNAASCTVNSANEAGETTETGCYVNDAGDELCTTPDETGDGAVEIIPVSSASLAAVNVSLIDYQLDQIIDGNDIFVEKATSGGSTSNTGRPDGAIDAGVGWTFAPGVDYSQQPCDPRTSVYAEQFTITSNSSPATGAVIKLCQIPVPFASGNNTNGANLVSSVISTNLMNMLDTARKAGYMIRLNDGFRIEFEAPYKSQHTTGLSLDLGVDGENTICRAGAHPQYGWYSADNAETQCARIGGGQYDAYKWLQENAATYGFHDYVLEPWHWSTSGQ